MAASGVSVDLFEAVRAAEKREKAARQVQSDMLVDMALEWAYLRSLLRRVVMVAANLRGEAMFGLREEDMDLLREAARAAGLDDRGTT